MIFWVGREIPVGFLLCLSSQNPFLLCSPGGLIAHNQNHFIFLFHSLASLSEGLGFAARQIPIFWEATWCILCLFYWYMLASKSFLHHFADWQGACWLLAVSLGNWWFCPEMLELARVIMPLGFGRHWLVILVLFLACPWSFSAFLLSKWDPNISLLSVTVKLSISPNERILIWISGISSQVCARPQHKGLVESCLCFLSLFLYSMLKLLK